LLEAARESRVFLGHPVSTSNGVTARSNSEYMALWPSTFPVHISMRVRPYLAETDKKKNVEQYQYA
jgi:hypothetical protein